MDNNIEKTSNQNTPKFINSRFKIIIAFIAISISVIYLVISSFSSATTNYLSVKDAIDESQNSDTNLGVIGKLVPNTFRRSTDGLTAYFSITDEFTKLPWLQRTAVCVKPGADLCKEWTTKSAPEAIAALGKFWSKSKF